MSGDLNALNQNIKTKVLRTQPTTIEYTDPNT